MSLFWSSSYYLGLAYTGIVSLVSTLSSWVIPATILSVKANPNSLYQFTGFTLTCIFSIIGIIIIIISLVRAYGQLMMVLNNYNNRRVHFIALFLFILVVWVISLIFLCLKDLAQNSQEGMFYSSVNKRASIGNQNGIIGRIW